MSLRTRLLTGAASVLLLVAVLVIFRAPILEWFTLGWFSTSATTESHASHSFPDESLDALRAVFDETETIRVALSEDRVDSVPAAVERAQERLGAIPHDGLPPSLHSALDAAETSLTALQTSSDAPEARGPYAKLARALFLLATADPRLQEGWNTFSCPMAEDFPKWFQRPAEMENPYMGQAMLTCGWSTDWAAGAPPATDAVAYYTCPMHPSVRAEAQEPCPICSMDLTPVTEADLRTGDILVDSIRRQRIGVRTEPVTRRPLSRSLRLAGEVAWDESRVVDVTARVDGWVEDLSVERIGDPVRRGTPLLDFYSPELLTAQRELLAAAEGSRLAQAATDRLRLWGMPSAQIADVVDQRTPREQITLVSPIKGVVTDKGVHAGAHVSAGALLYRIVDDRRVWVLADLFEQDLPHVAIGQPVTVSVRGGAPRAGEIAYLYPSLSPATRTGRARIELANPDGLLRPGQLATLELDIDLGEHLVVPTEAVIYTGDRRLVFLDLGEGRLRPVEVTVGPETPDGVAILEGLSEGDVVVSSGVFLLAAESRIRSATGYWEASDAD